MEKIRALYLYAQDDETFLDILNVFSNIECVKVRNSRPERVYADAGSVRVTIIHDFLDMRTIFHRDYHIEAEELKSRFRQALGIGE